MSGDAKQTMTMNMNLSADEQAKVEAIDGKVFEVAFKEQNISGRLLWDAAGDEGARTIRLSAVGVKEPLLSIDETKFAELSEDDLLERLRHRPR